jgi:hypothetical protein
MTSGRIVEAGPWDLSLELFFSSDQDCSNCEAGLVPLKASTLLAESETAYPKAQLRTDSLLQVGAGEVSFILRFDQMVTLVANPGFIPIDLLGAPLGVRYVEDSLKRVSTLDFTFRIAYEPKTDVNLTSTIALFLVPGAAVNAYGKSCGLAKSIFFASPVEATFNPPLLGSSDLGMTNRDKATIDIVFGERVRRLTVDSIEVVAAEGNVTYASKELKAIFPALGIYRLYLFGLAGEGMLVVSLPNGLLATVGGGPILPTSINLTRDVTPPQVVVLMSSSALSKEAFQVAVNFSEPVAGFAVLSLLVRKGMGQASISQLRAQSSGFQRNYSCVVQASSSEASRRRSGIASGLLELAMELGAGSFRDFAGNGGPVDETYFGVQLDFGTLEGLGLTTTDGGGDVGGFWEKLNFPSLESFLVAVASVVLVLVSAIAAVLLWKRRRTRGYQAVSTNPDEEFTALSTLAFNQYSEGEDVATFEQIVTHSMRQGFPRAVAESGARKLMTSVGVPEGGQLLTREEWIRWIKRKIAKGEVPTMRDCEELKFNFALELTKLS